MKMNRNLLQFSKYIRLNGRRRNYSSKDENEPIKFSTSPAARKFVQPIVRKITKTEMPWYQPYSVVASVSAFMFYFFVVREENDVDFEFSKTLFDRIQGLEKHQLLQAYKYNKEHGKSVEDIEQRLRELEAEEAKLVVQ